VYQYILKNENHNQQITDQDFLFKTKVYFLIKFDQIYGTLTVKKHQLLFEPDFKAPENEHLISMENPNLTQNRKVEDYICIIDYLDVAELNMLPLINETACLSEERFIQENYKYDMFLQVMLSSINGITL
jgi:hypothetical protein